MVNALPKTRNPSKKPRLGVVTGTISGPQSPRRVKVARKPIKLVSAFHKKGGPNAGFKRKPALKKGL